MSTTIIQDGSSCRVEFDFHYVTEDEIRIIRRCIASLHDENAKLRELVRVMAYCMQQGRDCDGCAANGADGAATAPSGCDWLRDRMREMGVVE